MSGLEAAKDASIGRARDGGSPAVDGSRPPLEAGPRPDASLEPSDAGTLPTSASDAGVGGGGAQDSGTHVVPDADVCEPASEHCDGIDNDCDGLVDRDPITHESKCECSATPLRPTLAIPDEDQAHNTAPDRCTTERCDIVDHALVEDLCCTSGAWSQCRYSPIDLSKFDADAPDGGHGLLEVVLYLAAPAPGLSLSLYYGSKYPARKQFSLITAAESKALQSSLVYRYFRPEDARCPRYQQSDLNLKSFMEFPNFPEACLGDTQKESWHCHGRWSSLSPACAFDYSAAELYLTAEQCDGEVKAGVQLVSVRYIEDPTQCSCRDDGVCPDGQRCRFEARVAASFCSPDKPDCGGICAGVDVCPHQGEPCGVTLGAVSCSSHVRCAEGLPTCPVPESCK